MQIKDFKAAVKGRFFSFCLQVDKGGDEWYNECVNCIELDFS